jgi:hypothetical protein
MTKMITKLLLKITTLALIETEILFSFSLKTKRL